MSTDPPDIAKRKQDIVGVFNRTAPVYDQVGPHFFTHLGHRLVELAQIPSGARVLDVATGRGAVLFPAIDAVGPLGYAVGIDLSEAMVRETTEEIRRLQIENAEVRQMDAEYLQYPRETFDYVLCGSSLLFFPQPERALSEMQRVLKPNGRIALYTWDVRGDAQWKWFEEDLVNTYLPAEEVTKPKAGSQPQPSLLDTPDELEGAMARAGFTNIRVHSESVEKTYCDEQEWWSALWSNSMRQYLERVEAAAGSSGLERFRQDVFKKLQTMKQADGIHQIWLMLFAQAVKPFV